MKGKLHYWTLEILFILLIIFIGTKVSFLFQPVAVFVSTLFFPILISGFLYFLLNPIVQQMIKYRIPKTLSIFIIYLVFIGLLVLISTAVGPTISEQVTSIVKNMPSYVRELREHFDEFSKTKYFDWLINQQYIDLNTIESKLLQLSKSFTETITTGISSLFSFIANLSLIIVTVPFILFYMLKDGYRLPDKLMPLIPNKLENDARKILSETGTTLATYIQGQMIVCLFVGIASIIGYFAIGLENALTFGIIIGVMNVIPYVGPFIGAAPAVVFALMDSPLKAILAIIVVVIVQQIDSNVISPMVIGSKLEIHPLMIIIILLVAGNLAGILGMILAVPTYAVSRILIKNFRRMWVLNKK